MFKFKNKKDISLVMVSIGQGVLLLLPFGIDFSFRSLVLLMIVNVYFIGLNYQCIAHNFIHLPFFNLSRLNSLFSVYNSLILGFPQSMYRVHHLDHHRYNNHPEKDLSSTLKYGHQGQDENIFTYVLLGIFRTDLIYYFKVASKHSRLVKVELLSILISWIVLALVNLQLWLFYLMGSFVLGQMFALWENYCEHRGAQYTDRKRDSVSCYDKIYNVLWFNNGYHQEHHFSPQTHWSEMEKVKALLPQDRAIVRYCHLSNSFK